MEGIHSVEDLKRLLFKALQASSQKEAAKKLGISEPTFSRIFSNSQEFKKGPKIENVNKIVRVLAEHLEMGEHEIKERVYGIIYGENKQEFITKPDTPANDVKRGEERLQNKEEEGMLLEPVASERDKKAEMEEKIKKAAGQMMLGIGYEMRAISLDWGNYAVVLYEKERQKHIPYTGHRVERVLGVGLTEENYLEVIHRVANLDEEDGIVILYCEQINVLDRAWKDDSLKVWNNLLLFDLSNKAKWYVKSVRKGEKKFLEFLFGKNNLVFPRN